ncbi:outer membrane protein assembly factor BamB family protein [Flavitalea sp.]|nr:PQQ-binding-like beta-propeller repeat protein [Flavitalea sp.]
MIVRLKSIFVLCILSSCTYQSSKTNTGNWPEYNGGPDRNHYSDLDEINKENLSRLEVAWIYHSGGADTVRNRTQMQCNPIIINGILYGVSADSQAFAVQADNGKEIWKTNIKDETFSMTSRGVTYFENDGKPIIFFGYGEWLYALDANSGKLVSTFGAGGKINLRDGLSRPGADKYIIYNTPGIIHKNLLIAGGRVAEGPTALPGDIRAFDVHTGKVVWTFKTIPENNEEGSETWPKDARKNNGGANSWMGMAIDRDKEIVYAPTGSASFDFYGGDRKGNNLYANSLLALDANTGKRIWHFQFVHHDIWDRDPPAPPNLVTIHKDNRSIDAVVQLSKQGFMFVFDRSTGKPIFPVEERPVPASEMPGEYAAATQPFPVLPEPFTRQSFTEADLRKDVANGDSVHAQMQNSNTGQPFIPLSSKRTLFFPGTDGGAQWGGAAVDREDIIYVPAKEVPVYSSLVPTPALSKTNPKEDIYQVHCGSCHGTDRKGDHGGSYPSLTGIGDRYSQAQLIEIINKGRGMMPALAHISKNEKEAVVAFLLGKKSEDTKIESQLSTNPYVITGYNRWYDSTGYPVNTPPWGTLTAINLSSGKRLWQVPLGEYAALKAKGVPATGTDNYGGPLVTAGGLIFIAATPDKKFRAIDKKTGKVLWEHDLPAAGFASPSTYSVNGRQYIVIACGGGKLRGQSGDGYVAFAIKK